MPAKHGEHNKFMCRKCGQTGFDFTTDYEGRHTGTPSYSTDIAAAMQVLERFWAYGIDWCRGTIPEGTVTIHGRNGEQVSASGDSAPLAICRAALLAKLKQN